MGSKRETCASIIQNLHVGSRTIQIPPCKNVRPTVFSVCSKSATLVNPKCILLSVPCRMLTAFSRAAHSQRVRSPAKFTVCKPLCFAGLPVKAISNQLQLWRPSAAYRKVRGSANLCIKSSEHAGITFRTNWCRGSDADAQSCGEAACCYML
jgi:hypothetical protein